MRLFEQFNVLRRFTLFRWQLAVHLAWPILWFVRILVDWPPEGLEYWPAEAVQTTRNLIQGGYGLAFAAWLAAALSPVVWIPNPQLKRLVIAGIGVVAGSGVLLALLKLLAGLSTLFLFPLPGVQAIGMTVGRVLGIPVGCGLLPIAWYYLSDYIQRSPFIRRLFYSGQGATGGFMTGEEIRKYVRPLPKRLT